MTLCIIGGAGAAVFETFTYKNRKQQTDIDTSILLKFIVFLCSSMGNVLFALGAILNFYLYFEYNTQHVVRVLPPFEDLTTIKIFYVVALACKAIKLSHMLMRQINCEITFIDWERPKVFENQITLKPTSNLETPSICSSVSSSHVLLGNQSFL